MISNVHEFWRANKGAARKAGVIRAEIRANKKLFAADMIAVFLSAVIAILLAAGSGMDRTEWAVMPEFLLATLVTTMPILFLAGFYRRHRHSTTMQGLLQLVPGTLLAVIAGGVIGATAGLTAALPLTTYPIMFLLLLTMFAGTRVIALNRELVRRHRKLRAQDAPAGPDRRCARRADRSGRNQRPVHARGSSGPVAL